MEIDLNKGISLKIEGELGRYQTLSIDSLIKIAETLQELILTIAKNDLPVNESIDLNNFKLELTDFQKGSAIPTFALTQRVQTLINSDYSEQRKEVSKKLNILLNVSDKGTYYDLKDLYPEYARRNDIVESLYGFTTSFKNSPVSIFEKDDFENKSFKPKPFKPSVKKNLIVEVNKINSEIEKEEKNAFATISIIKRGEKITNKIKEVILPNHHSLSYSPEIINVNNKQYILHHPLRCLFEKIENYYLIENEILDLIGTGETQDEAEINFNEEFDFLYQRLNNLNDNELSEKFVRIKNFINSFVKEVK
jgi:hypothetical protein